MNTALPAEFASVPLTCFEGAGYESRPIFLYQQLLETYYSGKSVITRIRQKSVDLRRIVQTALERNYKKYDLQLKQLKDTEKRDRYRVYGELLNTYGYELSGGEGAFVSGLLQRERSTNPSGSSAVRPGKFPEILRPV